jgi:hypothetical protein
MRTLFVSLALVFATACSDDGGSETPKDAAVDAPPTPDAGCFAGTPTTHLEIINACTSAQKIYKNSHPALMAPDGTLPALPP